MVLLLPIVTLPCPIVLAVNDFAAGYLGSKSLLMENINRTGKFSNFARLHYEVYLNIPLLVIHCPFLLLISLKWIYMVIWLI